MDIQKKLYAINNIEQNGLSIFELKGINWWPLIRIYLFQKHEPSNNLVKTNIFNKEKLIYPKRVLWQIRLCRQTKKQLNIIPEKKAYRNLTRVDSFYLTSENNYKPNNDGKLINRYLDPLYFEDNKSKAIFVRSKKDKKDYLVSDLLPVHFFELKFRLRTEALNTIRTIFLLKETPTFSKKYRQEFSKMIKYIQSFEHFEKFNFEGLWKWIDDTKRSESVAKILFQKTRPKQLIQYCYYFPAQFGYTLAANQLGIKTVDYQHGSQNEFHYAYGKWVNVPRHGYNLLPKEFWVYSQKEEENLLKYFLGSAHTVKIVGNVWASYWRKNKKDCKNIEWIDLLISRGFNLILFSVSSYLMDEKHFFWDYLKSCEDRKLYFLFRLHPGHTYLKEKLINTITNVNFSNYNITDATNTELYDLLNSVDLHVTQNSTIAEEALAFDLTTIIVDDEIGKLYFKKYIDTGHIHNTSTLADFKEKINQILEAKKFKLKAI